MQIDRIKQDYKIFLQFMPFFLAFSAYFTIKAYIPCEA